ncbi:uncharacterized protein LOC135831302 [Planococcus citri]|uniref:uncharacterized protein LOC135831302 n=1 Tax=Planococcus citri TaxID=170843 RepID=UPI0031FA1839
MSAKECCEKYAHSPVPVTVTQSPYSKHHDISVKVGEEIFPLNRLQLALVSNYFEKLFTEYYVEKDSKLVEIGALDSKTFSAIVDIIDGKSLSSLINADNFVSLLMGMDYLQMEIRLFDFRTFIEQYAGDLPFDPQIFQLFDFICFNQSYEYLRSTIYTYLFHYIVELPKYQEFFLLQLDDLIDIIKAAQPSFIKNTSSSFTRYSNAYEMNVISQMCSKWICHDVEKRRHHFLALVNAANCTLFKFSFQISPSNAGSVLSKMEECCKEEEIGNCFYQLLNYNGQIIEHPDVEQPRKRLKGFSCAFKANEINKEEKLTKFLENGYLHDVTIQAGKKTYKLHRAVLRSACCYFDTLFSVENCEQLVQSEDESLIRKGNNELYVTDFSENAFDAVVKYIYFDDTNISFNTHAECLETLKMGKTLKMDVLIIKSLSWSRRNMETSSIEDILQILNLSVDDDSFKNTYCKFISIHVERFLDSEVAEKLTRDEIYRLWNVAEISSLKDVTDTCIQRMADDLQSLKIEDILEMFDEKHGKVVVRRILSNLSRELSFDKALRILRTNEGLKFEEFTSKCMEWITESVKSKSLTVENIIEVLNFTDGKEKFENERVLFFCGYIDAKWPDINEALFSTISCPMLENILASPFLFSHNIDNILDICAKWVLHDIKSRYCLIPKIAIDINHNRMVNLDDHKIAEVPSDLNNCSQQIIRDKLWEILRSTSLVPHSDSRNLIMKEKSIFISPRSVHSVLDIELNEIALLSSISVSILSATLISGNLFVLGRCYPDFRSVFLVYDLSSKKLYYLAEIPFMETDGCNGSGTILNCNDQAYCCFSLGETMLRYSVELNRWEVTIQPKRKINSRDQTCFLYTSDGSNLYRVFKARGKFVAQTLNFTLHSWTSLPDLPNFPNECEHPLKITNIVNGIAVLSQSMVYIFNRQLESWRKILLPLRDKGIRNENGCFPLITHYNSSIIYAYDGKMYQLDLHHLQEGWILMKDQLYDSHLARYVIVIHRA